MNAKIYQKTVELYFQSERPNFYDCLSAFWAKYRYHGECEPKSETTDLQSGRFFYTTDLYEKCKERELQERGFRVNLPDDDVEMYFGSDYSPDQLFAIMFGLWYGLSKRQIKQIAETTSDLDAWDRLNYALCISERQTTEVQGVRRCYVYSDREPRNMRSARIVPEDVIVTDDSAEVWYIV